MSSLLSLSDFLFSFEHAPHVHGGTELGSLSVSVIFQVKVRGLKYLYASLFPDQTVSPTRGVMSVYFSKSKYVYWRRF